MLLACEGLEDLADCMMAALQVLKPYLREQEREAKKAGKHEARAQGNRFCGVGGKGN
jgi:hypothetical protein